MNVLRTGLLWGLLIYAAMGFSQEYPGEHWKKYTHPEDAGFSTGQLEQARAQFEANGGAALLAVYKGRVVAEWGQVNRRFRQASIRKSYLSALIGIYAEKGNIDLNKTLAGLGIDDVTPLTETERQARVIDLLSARSGIYLPSAYMPRGMEANLPERGSHAPGEFWYYNNWDFNTLATIFMQETGKDLFEAFKTHFAVPLQMEDFRMSDTYYRYEKDKSEHPAYLFRLSARDMARFGYLFLNKGRWKDRQLVPADWVKKSTGIVTRDLGPLFSNKGSYGLLWWISRDIGGSPMFYASGAGGQRICVFPEDDLVVVHLADTYQNHNVPEESVQELLGMILKARVGEPASEPQLETLSPPANPGPMMTLPRGKTAVYLGEYLHPFLGTMTVQQRGDQLTLGTNIGEFNLYPRSENTFLIEDMNFNVEFEKGDGDQKRQVKTTMNEKREILKAIMYY